jgi:hypothetical protein
VTVCAAPADGVPDDAGHGRMSSDPDEMKREATKELDAQLRTWKGLAVTVRVQGERADPDTLPPTPSGSHARCKVTEPVTMHDVEATLEVADGGHTRTKRTTLAAAEIDGDWYFLDLPAPPTTTAELTRLRDRMCGCATDRDPIACTDKIERAFEEWSFGVRDDDLRSIEDQIVVCRRTATRAR